MNSIIENASINNKDTEVDSMLESILIIWNDRNLVFVVTLVFTIMGFIYTGYILKDTNEFEINIYPLTQNQTNEFLELDRSINKNFDGNLIINFSPGSLLKRYINALSEREVFIRAFMASDYIKQSEYQTDQEFIRALRKVAFNILIERANTEQDIEQSNVSDYWTMKFSYTGNVETVSDMIEFLKIESINKVNEDLNSLIIENIRIKQAEQEVKIIDLNKNIKNIKDDYSNLTRNRIIFLKEQSQIARELGIKKSPIENLSLPSMGDNKNIITFMSDDEQYYKNGYIALEKEIELIEQRKELDPFIPELINLKSNLRSIVESPELSRFEKIYKDSPIYKNKDFESVNLDIAAIKVVNQTNALQIFIVFIIAGVFASSIFLIFRHNYKTYIKKKQL